MIHKNLTGDAAIHQAAYVQDSDPGAVGKYKLWIDITNPANPLYKVRNIANSGWDDYTPAGSLPTHASTHKDGGSDPIKLDELAEPDDNTDLDASTSKHGLMQKYPGGTSTFLRADGTFAAPAGGGGGGPAYPDAAPGSPSAYDDEFTAGSLDAKWTVITAAPSGYTTTPNKHGTFLCTEGKNGSGDGLYKIRQTITQGAGSALSVTAKFSLSGIMNDGDGDIELWISDSNDTNTGNYTCLYISRNSNSVAFKIYRGGAGQANETIFDHGFHSVYVHYQRESDNTYSAWWSLDGLAWSRKETTSLAWNATYLILNMTTKNGKPSKHLVDWVRVNWLTLPM